MTVSIDKRATLASGGQGVTVTLTVRCAPGLEVLEANLSVSQGNTSAFTGFGGFSCTGRRQTVSVTATSFGDPFVPGEAFASAFVLVIDPDTQQTQQGQDSRTVKVS